MNTSHTDHKSLYSNVNRVSYYFATLRLLVIRYTFYRASD